MADEEDDIPDWKKRAPSTAGKAAPKAVRVAVPKKDAQASQTPKVAAIASVEEASKDVLPAKASQASQTPKANAKSLANETPKAQESGHKVTARSPPKQKLKLRPPGMTSVQRTGIHKLPLPKAYVRPKDALIGKSPASWMAAFRRLTYGKAPSTKDSPAVVNEEAATGTSPKLKANLSKSWSLRWRPPVRPPPAKLPAAAGRLPAGQPGSGLLGAFSSKADGQKRPAQDAPPPKSTEPRDSAEKVSGIEIVTIDEDPSADAAVPDWRKSHKRARTMKSAEMAPAPKKAEMTPAPKKSSTATTTAALPPPLQAQTTKAPPASHRSTAHTTVAVAAPDTKPKPVANPAPFAKQTPVAKPAFVVQPAFAVPPSTSSKAPSVGKAAPVPVSSVTSSLMATPPFMVPSAKPPAAKVSLAAAPSIPVNLPFKGPPKRPWLATQNAKPAGPALAPTSMQMPAAAAALKSQTGKAATPEPPQIAGSTLTSAGQIGVAPEVKLTGASSQASNTQDRRSEGGTDDNQRRGSEAADKAVPKPVRKWEWRSPSTAGDAPEKAVQTAGTSPKAADEPSADATHAEILKAALDNIKQQRELLASKKAISPEKPSEEALGDAKRAALERIDAAHTPASDNSAEKVAGSAASSSPSSATSTVNGISPGTAPATVHTTPSLATTVPPSSSPWSSQGSSLSTPAAATGPGGSPSMPAQSAASWSSTGSSWAPAASASWAMASTPPPPTYTPSWAAHPASSGNQYWANPAATAAAATRAAQSAQAAQAAHAAHAAQATRLAAQIAARTTFEAMASPGSALGIGWHHPAYQGAHRPPNAAASWMQQREQDQQLQQTSEKERAVKNYRKTLLARGFPEDLVQTWAVNYSAAMDNSADMAH